MGKKQVAVSLRKPPPADPDAFVAGGGDARPPAGPEQRAAEGPNVVTRVGERRELTVYLPVPLARQLSVRCVELDRDVSSLVAESLVKSLAIEEAAPAVALHPAPAPSLFGRWSRARELVSQVRARLPLGLGLA
ncbi:MAG TPA: hypothetical protein VII82_09590 [Polyangiaceae bacterium]|jgi:hypothetical protein